VDTKWRALSEGGTELMPLGEYPFSKRYGWIQDKYGLSWQLMLVEEGATGKKITPNMLFTNEACGRAEEAIKYYVEVFDNSAVGTMSRYAPGEAELPKAKINYGAFTLDGGEFSAMDNGFETDFRFNEAFSFIINCKGQSEIDYFWKMLSAVPEAEECGWVKDKFGVSWQIIPTLIHEMMRYGSKEQIKRVTEAFLKMKKFDIEVLQKAYDGY
jgi:predicted 3-demethylubiquinone-9 3-methyltransferase (glyoxalase superfamily)